MNNEGISGWFNKIMELQLSLYTISITKQIGICLMQSLLLDYKGFIRKLSRIININSLGGPKSNALKIRKLSP